ncbi:hypothetical protein GXM_05139 [Nostoc sphaeroides CCNUC1]|uniref:Uncharacterized protein n=1 Tax=Nostoc sphaeroides CCNUC1 TaxID=2653204 RepID=A0A5P8W4I1_9NOSO|nr:hypothetical protein GXM_05139 [Nostoc sphaeroides CCNUC1]
MSTTGYAYAVSRIVMRIILFQSSSLLLKDLTKCTARAIAF